MTDFQKGDLVRFTYPSAHFSGVDEGSTYTVANVTELGTKLLLADPKDSVWSDCQNYPYHAEYFELVSRLEERTFTSYSRVFLDSTGHEYLGERAYDTREEAESKDHGWQPFLAVAEVVATYSVLVPVPKKQTEDERLLAEAQEQLKAAQENLEKLQKSR